MFRLGLLFIAVTSLELALLLEVGRRMGWGATIGLIFFTGFLGAYLARQQGFRVLREIQLTMQRGEMPATEILHGVCVLLAGAFLVTPGLLTDVFGFLLLFPPFRVLLLRGMRKRMEGWVKNNMVVVQMQSDGTMGYSGPGAQGQRPGGFQGPRPGGPHVYNADSDIHVYDATPKVPKSKEPKEPQS